MSDRKHTPDILAEILTGETPAVDLPLTPPPAPKKAPAASKTAATRQPRTAAPKARGQAPAPVPTPAEAIRPEEPRLWEHQVISFQHFEGWRARYIDGKEIKNWTRGMLVHECLEYMSEQGWKLAAATSGQALYGLADKYQLFFRRSR